MRHKFIFSLIMLLLLKSSDSFGAWYFAEITNGKLDEKLVGDDAQEFDFNGIPCLVGKTNFVRHDGDYISEYRLLKCSLTSNVTVQTSVTCQKPYALTSSLYFTIGDKGYAPMLICDYIK